MTGIGVEIEIGTETATGIGNATEIEIGTATAAAAATATVVMVTEAGRTERTRGATETEETRMIASLSLIHQNVERADGTTEERNEIHIRGSEEPDWRRI